MFQIIQVYIWAMIKGMEMWNFQHWWALTDLALRVNLANFELKPLFLFTKSCQIV